MYNNSKQCEMTCIRRLSLFRSPKRWADRRSWVHFITRWFQGTCEMGREKVSVKGALKSRFTTWALGLNPSVDPMRTMWNLLLSFPTDKWEDSSILATDFCLPLAEALCHSSGLPWCMTSFHGARKIPQWSRAIRMHKMQSGQCAKTPYPRQVAQLHV